MMLASLTGDQGMVGPDSVNLDVHLADEKGLVPGAVCGHPEFFHRYDKVGRDALTVPMASTEVTNQFGRRLPVFMSDGVILEKLCDGSPGDTNGDGGCQRITRKRKRKRAGADGAASARSSNSSSSSSSSSQSSSSSRSDHGTPSGRTVDNEFAMWRSSLKKLRKLFQRGQGKALLSRAASKAGHRGVVRVKALARTRYIVQPGFFLVGGSHDSHVG
jgi:hypothetical protein